MNSGFRWVRDFPFTLRSRKSHSHTQNRITSRPIAHIFTFLSKKAKARLSRPVGFCYLHIKLSYTTKRGLLLMVYSKKIEGGWVWSFWTRFGLSTTVSASGVDGCPTGPVVWEIHFFTLRSNFALWRRVDSDLNTAVVAGRSVHVMPPFPTLPLRASCCMLCSVSDIRSFLPQLAFNDAQ